MSHLDKLVLLVTFIHNTRGQMAGKMTFALITFLGLRGNEFHLFIEKPNSFTHFLVLLTLDPQVTARLTRWPNHRP